MVHVIIVLGCSNVLRDENKKTGKREIDCYFHSYSRLLKALEVYNNLDTNEKIIICSGYNNQAQNMKQFLIEKGVPTSRILEEPESRNTIENCIYSYNILKSWCQTEMSVQYLDGVDIDELKNIDLVDTSFINIHLVTNDYHIHRSNIIFNYFIPRIGEKTQIDCYSSNILDFIDNIDERDRKEVFDLHLHDHKIVLSSLDKSLSYYRGLYPFT